MGTPFCRIELAASILAALNNTKVASHDPTHVVPPLLWRALQFMLPLNRIQTCLLPLNAALVPLEFRQAGVICFTNHPNREIPADMHHDPFHLGSYEHFQAKGTADCCFLDVDPLLLDLLLPLAMLHAERVVIALVPVSWFSAPEAHRQVWLHDTVWTKHNGLFLRVRTLHGHLLDQGWLMLFPDHEARDWMLQGRVLGSCSDCLWDERNPWQLHMLGSMTAMHTRIFRRL
jgi:hypothetical protein